MTERILLTLMLGSMILNLFLVHHRLSDIEDRIDKEPEPKKVETQYIKAKVKAKVTAYCPCSKCCGIYSDGFTSTGRLASTKGAAVDPKRIPYGTELFIKGYGLVKADDTGVAMRKADGIHIDLRFPTHQAALEWGVRYIEIEDWRS